MTRIAINKAPLVPRSYVFSLPRFIVPTFRWVVVQTQRAIIITKRFHVVLH